MTSFHTVTVSSAARRGANIAEVMRSINTRSAPIASPTTGNHAAAAPGPSRDGATPGIGTIVR